MSSPTLISHLLSERASSGTCRRAYPGRHPTASSACARRTADTLPRSAARHTLDRCRDVFTASLAANHDPTVCDRTLEHENSIGEEKGKVIHRSLGAMIREASLPLGNSCKVWMNATKTFATRSSLSISALTGRYWACTVCPTQSGKTTWNSCGSRRRNKRCSGDEDKPAELNPRVTSELATQRSPP